MVCIIHPYLNRYKHNHVAGDEVVIYAKGMDNQPLPSQPAFPGGNNPMTTPPPQPAENSNNKKKILLAVVISLVVLGMLAGVYAWQNSKVKSLDTKLKASTVDAQKLKSQKAKLEQTNKKLEEAATEEKAEEPAKAAAPATPTSSIDPNLIPGQVETNRSDGQILVAAVYKPSSAPSELWVEYGKSPDKLDKSTAKLNKGLALGDDGQTFSFGATVSIPSSAVETGANYFYRVGATYNGKAVYGPVGSFTTKK